MLECCISDARGRAATILDRYLWTARRADTQGSSDDERADLDARRVADEERVDASCELDAVIRTRPRSPKPDGDRVEVIVALRAVGATIILVGYGSSNR